MEKTEQLYEGKAKKVWATDDPEIVIVDYKDDATAFNGLKKGTIAGKGVVNNKMSNYLMQILEKNDQMLQDEDKDYLLDDSAEIARIIMKVAQNNVDWDTLSSEEQSLITDYANIFEEEGKARAEHLAQEIGMEMVA